MTAEPEGEHSEEVTELRIRLGALGQLIPVGGVRGDEVARAFVRLLAESESGGTAQRSEFGSSGPPVPHGRSLVALLAGVDRLAESQAELVSRIVAWYEDFWALSVRLSGCRPWQSAIIDSVREYAHGHRRAYFRPYYTDIRIEPAWFKQWLDRRPLGALSGIGPGDMWRGPVASLRALEEMLAGRAVRPPRQRLDYHACGSPSFLSLGDTGHSGFDSSHCWICPGSGREPCGALCVDITD